MNERERESGREKKEKKMETHQFLLPLVSERMIVIEMGWKRKKKMVRE